MRSRPSAAGKQLSRVHGRAFLLQARILGADRSKRSILVLLGTEPIGIGAIGRVDRLLDRAEPVEVHAIKVPALPVTDILTGKLLALREHNLDLGPVVEVARSVREQIDWDELRRRTADSPYAKGFFAIVEELGLDQA